MVKTISRRSKLNLQALITLAKLGTVRLLDWHGKKLIYITSFLLAWDAFTVGLFRVNSLDVDIIVTNDVNLLDCLRLMTGRSIASGSLGS
jgi:hypothetical protein